MSYVLEWEGEGEETRGEEREQRKGWESEIESLGNFPIIIT